jgi:hypothetical protein
MYIFIRKEVYNQNKSQINSNLYGTSRSVAFYWLNEENRGRYEKVSIFTTIETHTFEKVV